MAKSPKQKKPDIATQIMERMVRMPPKQHKDMKLGKPRAKQNRKMADVDKRPVGDRDHS